MYTQEEIIHDLIAESEEKGRSENRIETATTMLKKGFDHETVAECSKLSIERVEELARSLPA